MTLILSHCRQTLDLNTGFLPQCLMWVRSFPFMTQGSKFPPYCDVSLVQGKKQSVSCLHSGFLQHEMAYHFCLNPIGQNSVKWSQSICKGVWECYLSVFLRKENTMVSTQHSGCHILLLGSWGGGMVWLLLHISFLFCNFFLY